MIQTAATEFMQRPVIRQFVKFCIIGFTSMIIDVGLAWLFTFGLHFHWIIGRTLSFSVAVTNGFIWNSLWTFRGLGAGSRHSLYAKFVAVNVIGLILNILIMKSVFFLYTGKIIKHGNPTKPQWMVATGVAVVIVALWNFLANKKFTFKGERLEE